MLSPRRVHNCKRPPSDRLVCVLRAVSNLPEVQARSTPTHKLALTTVLAHVATVRSAEWLRGRTYCARTAHMKLTSQRHQLKLSYRLHGRQSRARQLTSNVAVERRHDDESSRLRKHYRVSKSSQRAAGNTLRLRRASSWHRDALH